MKIAFFADHLGERGTEVALFDYAYYNHIIIHNIVNYYSINTQQQINNQ